MSNERCFEACACDGYVVVLACAYCKAFHSWWRACCKMARGVATFMRMNPSPPCPNISPSLRARWAWFTKRSTS